MTFMIEAEKLVLLNPDRRITQVQKRASQYSKRTLEDSKDFGHDELLLKPTP